MGSQIVGHDFVTEQQQKFLLLPDAVITAQRVMSHSTVYSYAVS